MAGIVVVTHGKYGEGLLDALKLLLGEEIASNIYVVTLEPLDSPESLYEKIKEIVRKASDGKGVLVLVDLFGGTPSRAAALLLSEGVDAEIVSGVNLPMLIEVVLQRDKSARELAELALKAGVEGIVDIGEKVKGALGKKD